MTPEIQLDLQALETSRARERLLLCGRTKWIDEDAGGFEPDARVADGDWRAIELEEFARLRPQTRATCNTVALVRIESSLVERFRSIAELMRDPERRPDARRQLADAANLMLAALPSARWRLEGEPSFVGINVASGGFANTTINEQTGLRVGLHLDSFDRLDPADRRHANNRICINLGSGSRALQLVPFQAADFLAHLERRGVVLNDAARWPTHEGRRLDLARAFLVNHPEAPVLKLRLEPGEAYIAPTENMIHDGASDYGDCLDMTLTIRGRFVPCE